MTCDETFYIESAVQYTRSFGPSVWPQQNNFFFLPHGRLYWLILGSLGLLLGPSIAVSRFVSLLAILLLTLGTRQLALRYSDEWVANWSAILVITAWSVLHAGHLGRPDIVAAASVVWSAVLIVTASRKRSRLMLLLSGFALIMQLDLHLNALHFVLPLLILAGWELGRAHLKDGLWILVGAAAAGFILIALHAPSYFGAAGTVLGDDAPTTAQGNLLLLALSSLVRFWRIYYLWQLPYLSLITGSLLLTGFTLGWLANLNFVRKLNMVSLVAFITFGLINQEYQLLGYATLWLPFLTISGVATWRWLLGRFQVASLTLADVYVIGVAIAFFGVGLLLTVRGQYGALRAFAQAFEEQLPEGAVVLAAPYWDYVLPAHVVVADEHNLHPFGTNRYWNGAPDNEDVTAAVNRADVPAPIVELAPDYIIDDGVVGCLTLPDATSTQISDYIADRCEFVTEAFIPSTDVSRTHTLYACR